MQEKIQKLEAAVGKSIEQWNVEDLEKFSLTENLELLQLLKEEDVVTECLTRSSHNREVADIFVPLTIKAKLTNAEKQANDILLQHEKGEIDEEAVKEKAIEFVSSQNLYLKLSGYIVLISMFPEYDLMKHEIDIKTCIANLKEVICGLVSKALDSCYSLIQDLFELMFPLRTKFFDKYKIDILDDEDKRLETVLDNIHDYEEILLVQLQKLSQERNIGEENE